MVGTRDPNAWGLYDMLGNVIEWCHDVYVEDLGTGAAKDPWGPGTGGSRVLRSSSWGGNAGNVRAACRSGYDARFPHFYFGFRLARSLP